MARRIEVDITGDSRQLKRAFADASKDAKKFSRDVSTGVGGARRSVSTFAGGFLGGFGFAAVSSELHSIIDISAESQQILGQTRVSLEATGLSWQQYGKQIESVIATQSKLGFDDEALMQTFSRFVQTTKNVNTALALNNIAMGVSRNRYVSLETAANLVNRAVQGQTGAIRKLLPELGTGATKTEVLTALTQAYGTTAKKAGDDAQTSFDRAGVSAENLKQRLGDALLPTVTDLMNQSSDALDALGEIGKVKIPSIKIPFFFDFKSGKPGSDKEQTIGDVARNIAFTLPEFTKFSVNKIRPLFGLKPDWHVEKPAQETAEDLWNTIQTETQKAVTKLFGSKPIMLNAQPTFGLTPLDPATIQKINPFVGAAQDVPLQFKQALIDAQIKGDPAAERAVQQLIIDWANKLLARHLFPKVRLRISGFKQAAVDAVRAIDADFASGIEQATADRATRADAARRKRIADQFAMLGLDESGQLPAPSKAALARRFTKLVEGGGTVEHQNVIKALLFGTTNPEPEVRAVIDQLLTTGADRADEKRGTLIDRLLGKNIVPSVPNLIKQLRQLSKNPAISKEFSKRFPSLMQFLNSPEALKMTPEQKQAIAAWYKEARGEVTKGQSDLRAAFARPAVDTEKVLAGLGLTPKQLKALTGRLTGIPSSTTFSPGTAPSTFGGKARPIQITVHSDVYLDRQRLGTAVKQLRAQQMLLESVQGRGPNKGI